jgi:uncharacterized protein (TIGR02145 family)
MKAKTFLLAAGMVLAMAFIFSCSSDDGSDGVDGLNGEPGQDCDTEEDGAYFVMKCGGVEKARWAKALCGGSTAYDPEKMTCDRGILSFVFTDVRDSKKYKAVIMGTQTWMAENLNYSGLPDTTLGYCYGQGVTGVSADSSAKNCATYGRLYDWATVMGIDDSYNSSKYSGTKKDICPAGWRLPENEEWSILSKYAGGNQIAGAKLRATNSWDDVLYLGSVHSNLDTNYVYANKDNKITVRYHISGNGTDDYGFAALSGGYGYKYSDGTFYYSNVGNSMSYAIKNGDYWWYNSSYWWTSSEDNGNSANSWSVYQSSSEYSSEIRNSIDRKTTLYSARCIKDE